MQAIQRDQIEEAWDEICDLDEKASTAFVQKFGQAQPFLLIYLYAQDEQTEGQGEDVRMISLAFMIWKLLDDGSSRQVNDRAIEKAENKNVRYLERLDAGPEQNQLGAAAQLIKTYNQSEILGFCLEILMSGYEEAPDLAPEDIGLQFLTLKTLIDCLDR